MHFTTVVIVVVGGYVLLAWLLKKSLEFYFQVFGKWVFLVFGLMFIGGFFLWWERA